MIQAARLCQPARRRLLRASLLPRDQHSVRSQATKASSTSAAPESPLLPQPSDIWVMPFQQAPELAIQRMELFASVTARSYQGMFSHLSKSLLGFRLIPNPIELTRWKAIYLPAWIWAAQVKGTAKRDASPNGDVARDEDSPSEALASLSFGGNMLVDRLVPQGMPKEVTGPMKLKNNFFPGTSISPLSFISFSVDNQINRDTDSPVRKYDPSHVPSVISTAKLLEETGSETIPAIPFDTSPLAIPDVLRRQSTIQSLPYTVSTEEIEWQKLEAVPIYLPLYIANFKTDDREFTLALAASEDEIGLCDIHFPPPPGMIDGPIKWPSKPLGSALFPRPTLFNSITQSPFLNSIDPDQWKTKEDRRLEEKLMLETGEKADASFIERSEAEFWLEITCNNIGADADRWLDSDGVRAQLSQASITARPGKEGTQVGRIVPFVKKDIDWEDDDEI